MKTVLHQAHTRGHANHGWLDSHHTFSFAGYRNPERNHFGVLRVLNDDVVAPGMGFSTHAHDNMEIISIPLEGDLKHQDSMGNQVIIKAGDVQVMSAGTGIRHSEFNASQDKAVKFLQIWVYPNKRNVTPRYGQITLDPGKFKNRLYPVLTPQATDGSVWIHQDAWFHLGDLEPDVAVNYSLQKAGNGVYVFILSGNITIENQALNARDGLGVWDTINFDIKANSRAKILLMEVPMDAL